MRFCNTGARITRSQDDIKFSCSFTLGWGATADGNKNRVLKLAEFKLKASRVQAIDCVTVIGNLLQLLRPPAMTYSYDASVRH